ncbi:MAG: tetratricopeptide repeat protein [Bacteroidia bacterium]
MKVFQIQMNFGNIVRLAYLLSVYAIGLEEVKAENLDSLLTHFSTVEDDQEKLKTGLNLARTYRGAKQYEEADFYADEAMKLALALRDTAGLARAHLCKGVNAFRSLKPYDLVSIHFLRSLNLFEHLNDSINRSWCLMQLGLIDYSIGDMEQAAENFENSIKYNPGLDDDIATARYLLGLSYSELGEFELANELLESSLTTYAANDAERELFVRTFIGRLKYNQGNYHESIAYLEEALSNFPLDDKASIAATRAYLSLCYLEVGDYKKAIYNGQYTIKHTDIESGILYWLEASKSLHKALAANGNLTEAYHILNNLVEMTDSISGSKVLERVTNQKAKYTYEKELIKEQAKQELEHQLQMRKQQEIRNIGLGSGVFALFLAAGFFSRWRFVNRAKKRIEEERDKSDQLLLNILPVEIATELKAKGKAEAQDFEQISVLFTDFKEFTQLSEQLTAKELVGEINHCFEAFDHICDKHKVEKIKTIGDSYMAAGGLPVPNKESTKNVVLSALEMADFVVQRKLEREAENKVAFEMRVGIHTGNVVAGIVGVKKFQYDIWGDTVNTASRMESNCEIGKVNISQATYEFLKDDAQFVFEHRGKVEAKGKGEIDMWFVSLGYT